MERQDRDWEERVREMDAKKVLVVSDREVTKLSGFISAFERTGIPVMRGRYEYLGEPFDLIILETPDEELTTEMLTYLTKDHSVTLVIMPPPTMTLPAGQF